jgi:putative glutathione S-transferase
MQYLRYFTIINFTHAEVRTKLSSLSKIKYRGKEIFPCVKYQKVASLQSSRIKKDNNKIMSSSRSMSSSSSASSSRRIAAINTNRIAVAVVTVVGLMLTIVYAVTVVDAFVVPSTTTATASTTTTTTSTSSTHPSRQSLSRWPTKSSSSFSSSLSNKNGDNNDNNSNIDQGFNLLGVASKVVPQGNIVKTAKFFWKFIWLRFMTELAPQDKTTGDYKRPSYGFDNVIGRPSSDGDIEFPIESGRYHIYVGNPCPWCHRVRLLVNILGLESTLDGITVLIDNPEKASRGGWIFDDNENSQSQSQQKPSFQDLRELYDYLSPGYTGRCTAPLLVDWKTKRIVSNESKDIVRMLPVLLSLKETEKDKEASTVSISLDPTLISTELQTLIDERNEWIYDLVNNGVYRCGFSTTQSAYDVASQDVLKGLQRIEDILSSGSKYLSSNTEFTESDLMLLPTILRYDGKYSVIYFL